MRRHDGDVGQAIAARFDRHGQGVFVPVGDRSLAGGEPAQRRDCPANRAEDGLARKAQRRNIGAERKYAVSHAMPCSLGVKGEVTVPRVY